MYYITCLFVFTTLILPISSKIAKKSYEIISDDEQYSEEESHSAEYGEHPECRESHGLWYMYDTNSYTRSVSSLSLPQCTARW